MKTFKYNGTDPFEINAFGSGLRVQGGDTFEVPDGFEGRFEAEPDLFAPSRTKSPDVTVDPDVAAALTGPIPVSAQTPNPTTTN